MEILTHQPNTETLQNIINLLPNLDKETQISQIKDFETTLCNNFAEACKLNNFFNLPINSILSIVSKVDFTKIEDYIGSIISLITETIKAHPIEQETLFLLYSLDFKPLTLTLDDCIKILSLFKKSSLLIQLNTLYNLSISEVDVDYEFQLEETKKKLEKAEEEIKNIKSHKFTPIFEQPRDFEPDIFKATREGKLTSVQYLIETKKVDPNITDKHDFTQLHYACLFGHRLIVEYLISIGADVNKKELNGNTPLHYAASWEFIDIVLYLIGHGADADLRANNGHKPYSISQNAQIKSILQPFTHNC